MRIQKANNRYRKNIERQKRTYKEKIFKKFRVNMERVKK